METNVLGLHHVTAITSDPQRNIDFYTGVLGLRLVKVTVNFDDPGSYHFYYGDEVGHPGTILTFFVWPGASRGRQGLGQISSVAFSIPQASLGYWVSRLLERGVQYQGPTTRMGESMLTFRDPDGLMLELVAQANVQDRPVWEHSAVPVQHAIRGIAGITLWEGGYEKTAHLLTDTLGFHLIAEEQTLFRYTLQPEHPENWVDIRCAPGFWDGQVASGTIHHVAWRTATDETQLAWHKKLEELNYNVTPVLDREYFHSIYFPEPGGILFEIATDLPGFTINESVERLGTHLQLPPWFEDLRPTLEQELPTIQYPSVQGAQ
jgi:Lactoylglutathione lyase and related lyases